MVLTCLSAFAIALVIQSSALAAEELKANIQLVRNFAKLVTIPHPASTVIIGNESVLSATLSDASTLVLTGQATGTTNLIILSKEGDTIAESVVNVVVAKEPVLRVHQGATIEDYDCTGRCDRVGSIDTTSVPSIPTE